MIVVCVKTEPDKGTPKHEYIKECIIYAVEHECSVKGNFNGKDFDFHGKEIINEWLN